MTEQEKINDIDKRVNSLETTFKMFMQEMRDFKTEMRQQNQMRAAEIMELRQDMKTMQTNLDTKIDNMGKHVRNLSVATILSFVAMELALVYSILTR